MCFPLPQHPSRALGAEQLRLRDSISLLGGNRAIYLVPGARVKKGVCTGKILHLDVELINNVVK